MALKNDTLILVSLWEHLDDNELNAKDKITIEPGAHSTRIEAWMTQDNAKQVLREYYHCQHSHNDMMGKPHSKETKTLYESFVVQEEHMENNLKIASKLNIKLSVIRELLHSK